MSQQKKKKMRSMTVTPTEGTLSQLLKEHCNSHAQRYTTHNDQLILILATKSVENILV
jgi:hypothetical protein